MKKCTLIYKFEEVIYKVQEAIYKFQEAIYKVQKVLMKRLKKKEKMRAQGSVFHEKEKSRFL